jgi:hypothetical protein
MAKRLANGCSTLSNSMIKIMIPPHHSESVVPVVALIISIFSLVVTIAGWFVVDLLSRRRDRQRDSEARRRNFDLAASDFKATIMKWLDLIGDKQQTALASVRAKSIPEIEKSIHIVRIHVNDSAKSRLEDEWKKYQRIDRGQLGGIATRQPETGSTIISYDDARQILSEPLKKIMEIIHPTGAISPRDIHSPTPDPNSPIDYEACTVKLDENFFG